MIPEKVFYCKERILSASVTGFIKAHAWSSAYIQEWYSGLLFCRTSFHGGRIIAEKGSVVEDRASKLWERNAWKIRIHYSNLSMVTFFHSIDVKILVMIIKYRSFSKHWKLHFLKKWRVHLLKKYGFIRYCRKACVQDAGCTIGNHVSLMYRLYPEYCILSLYLFYMIYGIKKIWGAVRFLLRTHNRNI